MQKTVIFILLVCSLCVKPTQAQDDRACSVVSIIVPDSCANLEDIETLPELAGFTGVLQTFIRQCEFPVSETSWLEPVPFNEWYVFSSGQIRVSGVDVNYQNGSQRAIAVHIEWLCQTEEINESCVGATIYSNAIDANGLVADVYALYDENNITVRHEGYSGSTLTGNIYLDERYEVIRLYLDSAPVFFAIEY